MDAIKRHWKDLAALAILFAMVLFFFSPFLSFKQVFYQEDFSGAAYPLFHWLHSYYSRGLEPLWSQAFLCGWPGLDEGSIAFFYPPLRLLLRYFGAVEAITLHYAFHYLVAAWGAYALARSRAISEEASAFAAVAAAFGGGLLFSQRSVAVLVSHAWFPWMLLGLLLIQDRTRTRGVLGAGILGFSTGMALCGGHLGMALYQVLALALVHFRWWLKTGVFKGFASLKPLALAALLASLFNTGMALGLSRLAGQSERGDALSLAASSENSLSPATLAQALLPYALGDSKDNSFLGASWKFGTWVPQGMLLYMGILAFLLLVLEWGSGDARGKPYYFAALALLIYALGDWTPLYEWTLSVPPFSHLRAPMKAAAVLGMLLCLPAAWGLDRLHQEGLRWPWILALALGLGLLALFAGLHFGSQALLAKAKGLVEAKVSGSAIHLYGKEYYFEKFARWLLAFKAHALAQGLFALGAGLALFLAARFKASWSLLPALALLFAELAYNGMHYLPRIDRAVYEKAPASAAFIKKKEGKRKEPFRIMSWGFAEQQRLAFPKGRMEGDLKGELRMNELMAPNANLLHGLDSYRGYSSAGVSRIFRMAEALDDFSPGDRFKAETARLLERRRLLDHGGVRYLLSAKPLKAPGLRLLKKEGVHIYQNERAYPLAWVAKDISGGWTPEAALEALATRNFTRPGLLEGDDAAPPAGQGSLEWLNYADLEWKLKAKMKGRGLVVLARTYYEGGWNASIDGKPARLMPANSAFCALEVPAGTHTLRVWFEDPRLLWGKAAFLAGLFVCFCLFGGLLLQALLKKPEEAAA